MSDFKVIVPASTTNKVLNPSAEIAGSFAAEAGTTVTRVTTFQHYGLYSYRVETNANNEGIEITLSALANAIHYVTVRVRGTLPTTWDWSLNDVNFSSPTLLETIDGDWKLYGLQFSATQANGSVKLSIHQNGTGSGDFYLDGIQVEENTTWTTFCDGTQLGCEWNGTPHGSTSTRSAESRAGGRVYDLEDDYGLKITGMSGTGTAPQELFSDSYSQLPGGELNAIKTNSRVFTLTGLISESTEAEFYQVKQTLESLFDPEAYPEDENGPQPIRLRFNGAAVHKEIAVHYEGGLETNITADDPCAWEKVAVRFLADDPYWSEIGESAALLDTEDSATLRYVAGRLRSTGQWSPLGPPGAGGTYTDVQAIAEDSVYVYFGGNFTNFDGIAAADRIVRYHKQTGVYSALGTGMNNQVWSLAIGPDGTLYAGGLFTTAGGGAALNIAAWDGSTWSALGSGPGDAVGAMAIGPDGILYAGGLFNVGSGGAGNYIASWDGSTWSALGTGMNDTVKDIVIAPDGTVYAGGDFTTSDGNTTNRVASWDGSAWSALGTGVGNIVNALALSSAGLLYAGGSFTTAGGAAASRVAVWNGSSWAALGTGVSSTVYSLAMGADGILYASGAFATAGGITLSDRQAAWNGYSWSHLGIDLPGTPIVYVILTSRFVDPVIPQKYSLYIGFDATGTGTYAGLINASNNGTAIAHPQIYFKRTGGTGATIQTLKNERTGLELLFNYSLRDGESLTIDLTPTKKSITSSFFGSRQDAVLANSDFGDWGLLTGSNSVSSFVSTSGSPTIEAWMIWKDKFKSQN